MDFTFETVNMTALLPSVSFDKKGKCYKFMGGYPVDRSSGNCNRLGGFFGIMHRINLEILSFQKKALKAFNWMGTVS